MGDRHGKQSVRRQCQGLTLKTEEESSECLSPLGSRSVLEWIAFGTRDSESRTLMRDMSPREACTARTACTARNSSDTTNRLTLQIKAKPLE